MKQFQKFVNYIKNEEIVLDSEDYVSTEIEVYENE